MSIKYKYSFAEVKSAFENKGYVLISDESEYGGSGVKLKYICNKHKDKGILEITPSHLLNGRGCYFCGRERTGKARRKEFTQEVINEYKNLCEVHGFEYVGCRKENSVILIDFVCLKHKEFGVQTARRNNIARSTTKGCKYCKGDLPSDYVISMIDKEYPHMEMIDDYVNMSTPIKFRCNKHGIVSKKAPNVVLNGVGCYECGIEKLRQKSTKTKEKFISDVAKANPDIEVVGDYVGVSENVFVRCKKCGNEWLQNPQSLLSNGTRCKKCSWTYKGEDLVSEVLDSMGIEYERQKKFPDCCDKRELPFDFYIPAKNCCIEFDGQQHYEPKFGTDNFNKTVLHDRIKTEYCRSNNIKLIRIPYWDSSNIKDILKEI